MAQSIAFWDPGNIAEGAIYQSNPWDTCYLGNLQIPGLVRVRCQPQREVDKKKRHGGDGAKITVYGYLPSEVVITVLIWTEPQFTEWQRIAPQLWPRAGKPAADAFQIRHPETSLWGITAVYIASPSSSADGPVPQSKLWTLKCVEQFEPTKKNTTKTQTGSTVALDPTYKDPNAKNAPGEPPSKTDTGPTGPPKKPKGGSF